MQSPKRCIFYSKIHVFNRVEAIKKAVEKGFIQYVFICVNITNTNPFFLGGREYLAMHSSNLHI
ncbi:hypothetical protein, partial [Bacillus pseudomycoides]|uniref:hypothetical protein n=1 Tax=Bacillus pseudomycoides TaxID=64104 RepID=UPI003000EFF9